MCGCEPPRTCACSEGTPQPPVDATGKWIVAGMILILLGLLVYEVITGWPK